MRGVPCRRGTREGELKRKFRNYKKGAGFESRGEALSIQKGEWGGVLHKVSEHHRGDRNFEKIGGSCQSRSRKPESAEKIEENLRRSGGGKFDIAGTQMNVAGCWKNSRVCDTRMMSADDEKPFSWHKGGGRGGSP